MEFYFNAYMRDYNRTKVWTSFCYDTKAEAEEEARKFEKDNPDLFTEIFEDHPAYQTQYVNADEMCCGDYE